MANSRIHELQLVGCIARQQVALASVAGQVDEVFASGLTVKVVKDCNALTVLPAGGSSDLLHVHESVLFAKGVVRPRLWLKANVHVCMPRRAFLRRNTFARKMMLSFG